VQIRIAAYAARERVYIKTQLGLVEDFRLAVNTKS